VREKHLKLRLRQCVLLAEASSCVRRKFGALLLDPERNVLLMDGYNGGPRGGSGLCGPGACSRDEGGIASGTAVEIGCHHAEMNVICNAAANGVSTRGAWLLITGEPCMMCAKLIHHAGISCVVVISNGYSTKEGVVYLLQHGIEVKEVDRALLE